LRFCIVSPVLRSSVCLKGTTSLSIVSRTLGRLPISMKFLPDYPKCARQVIQPANHKLFPLVTEVANTAVRFSWQQVVGEKSPQH
jgi:hypothetical protein